MIPDNVKKQIAAAAVHSVGSGIAWQKLFAKK